MGFISKNMGIQGKGPVVPTYAIADFPEIPLFTNSYCYYLYLYDHILVDRKVKTSAFYWNVAAPQYAFSSETDTKETISATLRSGGYLLATLNDAGPLYRVYPSFTIDGIEQVWADRDEDITIEDLATGTGATLFYFYPYSFDKCGSMKDYFIEACRYRDLPEGVYWASSKDYWQPVASLTSFSSSTSLIQLSSAAVYGGLIYEDIDGTFIYDYVKKDAITDENSSIPGNVFYALITLNSYYYQMTEDNNMEFIYGLDNCLPAGFVSSVITQDGVFPNDAFYYKDSEPIFLHETV